MTRDEKIRLIAGLRSGRIKPEDLQPQDLTKLTKEELDKLGKIVMKYNEDSPRLETLAPDEQVFVDSLQEAFRARPANYGHIGTLKEGLTAGKTLKQIAGELHFPWQDTAPLEKLMEYCKQNDLL